jgi:predicted glycogen debranching enzyme
MIKFGRDVCGDIHTASQKEWLVTNGIGGFASGTLSGILTRRYHGLLIAALRPPLGRTLLVSSLNETVVYDDQKYYLYAHRRLSGSTSPEGFRNIERFYLDDSIPVWHFSLSDVLIEKRIWMQPGENTTYIRYSVLRGCGYPICLSLGVLVNGRDFHGATHVNQAPKITITPCSDGMRYHSHSGSVDFYLRASHGEFNIEPTWQRNFYLSAEAARGESAVEDHLYAGRFETMLYPGQTLTLVASTQSEASLDGQAALTRRKDYESSLLSRAGSLLDTNSSQSSPLRQLVLAADQFIASRPTPDDADGKTILAGYPWFSDWGRDTMISLPGLSLVTGRPEIARSILNTFAGYVDQGMLPNRFPDQGETPEYNTVDATLWFFEALRAYLAFTNDLSLIRDLYPVLVEIIDWHIRGTRFNIHTDPQDGLLSAGNIHTQLTWMDVKIDEWAVTPRSGKAVEINALWYNALCCMEVFTKKLGQPAMVYQEAARKARRGFTKFWNNARGYLFDVLDEQSGADPTLRPNQLIAVSIPNSPLSPKKQKAVVDVCARYLLTSLGLRSLAPGEPGYIGNYGGGRWQRDTAYHQGTVWGWLIGPFISAHLRVYRDPAQAWIYLQPFFNHLADHGLGSVSEIFDGDAPFRPNGCIAQAWSVAEILRSARMIQIYARG